MGKKFIVISAVWCPSCLVFNRHLRKIKKEYSTFPMLHLDYDLDEEQVEKYQVGKILPVMIIEDEEGREIDRLIGEKSYDEIVVFIEKNM